MTGPFAKLPAFLRTRGSGAPSLRSRPFAVLIASAALLALSAVPASAATTFAGPGSAAGQVSGPDGVAVDQTTGNVYIADEGNFRIDAFDSQGSFLRAFGIGVVDGAHQLETCTTVCIQGQGLENLGKAGSAGAITPSSVAVDPTSHDVYVGNRSRYQIQKFTSGGEFLLMFGKGVDQGPHHPGNVCTAQYLAEGDICGIGALGTGPGQFSSERSPIALDGAGDVWVGDIDRIEHFSSEGAFLSEVKLPGAGEIRSLAVDPSGNFYALEPGLALNEIQQFELPTSGTYTLTFGGKTTGPLAPYENKGYPQLIEVQSALEALPSIGAGNVNVYFGRDGKQNRVEFRGALKATDLEQITASSGVTVETLRPGSPEKPPAVSKLKPSGELLYTLDEGGHPRALGLDPASGDLFVSDQVEGGPASLFEYDSSGAQTGAFGTGEVLGTPNGNALAYGDSSEGLYVVGGQAAQIFTAPPPGPFVRVNATEASSIAKTSATLNAEVNPEGHSTTFHFQYISEAKFKEDGEQFGEGTEETSESASIGEDFEIQPASQSVSALAPATNYRFRVIAHNEDGTAIGETASFGTLPPAAIDSTSVSGVSADSATLQAQINPLGDATSYHFEYLTEAAYIENEAAGEPPFSGAAQAPLEPASIGAGEADVSVSQHLQGLLAHTAYRYRVLIENAVSEANGAPFAGPVHAFTTQVPLAFALPDGRAWEQVSPPDKHGALLRPIAATGVIQAAAGGDAITYLGTAPPEADPQGAAGRAQILATRAAAGWSSIDLDIPHPAATGGSGSAGGEHRFFSDDLSLALLQPFALNGFTPLSPDTSEPTPYLRTDFRPADPTALCTSSCYRPLVSGCPPEDQPCPPSIAPHADVPPGTVFGGCELIFCGPYFRGATPDLAHVVLSSNVGLTAIPGDEGGLYEWSADAPPAEALRLISVLPGPAGEPANLESRPQPGQGNGLSERNAISADGSRVFWVEGPGPGSGRHLYLRDLAREETIQLDQVQGGLGAGQPAGPAFQLASTDGSRIFFTDSQQLAANSSSTGSDLYECRIGDNGVEELACDLTDLTPESAGEPAEVQGFLPGASTDGSSVYFVANGVLAQNTVDWGNGAEEAEPGSCVSGPPPSGATCNLYLRHEGTTTFIASLSGGDMPDWAGQGVSLAGLTTRVSHDGRWLAFMSQRPLTGYDNRDAVSGEDDEEVFLYDAAANGGDGSLICTSCNPTGARPHGVEYEKIRDKLAGGVTVWRDNQWLAANIPGWTPYELSGILYQSRYLSDSGRLFFNASDSLVPSDTNGNEDVYEFEPLGLGDCTTESATFTPRSGGCIGLISSGTSAEESAFLDASETGDDVFFLTASKLAPADLDTALDVYDARVGGGFPEPVPTVECAGDACQQPVVPPNDSTPGTLTVHGPGNLHQTKHKKKHKKRHHKARNHPKRSNKRANSNRGGVK